MSGAITRLTMIILLVENIHVDTEIIYQNDLAKLKSYIKDGKIFNAIHYSHEKANDIELRYSEILASRHYHCDHYHRITECVTS